MFESRGRGRGIQVSIRKRASPLHLARGRVLALRNSRWCDGWQWLATTLPVPPSMLSGGLNLTAVNNYASLRLFFAQRA